MPVVVVAVARKKRVLTISFVIEDDSHDILIFTQSSTKAASQDIIFYVSRCDIADLNSCRFSALRFGWEMLNYRRCGGLD